MIHHWLHIIPDALQEKKLSAVSRNWRKWLRITFLYVTVDLEYKKMVISRTMACNDTNLRILFFAAHACHSLAWLMLLNNPIKFERRMS